ncbi:MAG TPA: 30S ribosomal protein S17 [Patescibacteria group bacterium]|nr:30S ribosomal protein S17 [Patescibacteria group bacterium]
MARTLTGVVSSDRGDKTIVVTVASRKTHPLYKKQYTTSKKFMAHDEANDAHTGDTVTIAEVRPVSARKRFTLVKVVERAAIRHEEPVETEPSKASKKKATEDDASEGEAA